MASASATVYPVCGAATRVGSNAALHGHMMQLMAELNEESWRSMEKAEGPGRVCLLQDNAKSRLECSFPKVEEDSFTVTVKHADRSREGHPLQEAHWSRSI